MSLSMPLTSSLSRSSSEGCNRSRDAASAIDGCRPQLDGADIEQRMVPGIGGQHALAEPDPAAAVELPPFGTPRQADGIVLHRLGARVAGRHERRYLAFVGERQRHWQPDQILEVLRALARDPAQPLEGDPEIAPVDAGLEHRPEPLVS